MKLTLLFLSGGIVLLLLQTTLLHYLPLGPVVPDLALVLCVYLALNRPTVSSVIGSFLMGYSVDVFSSPILGVNAFALSLVFLIAYLSSRYIWVHNPFLSAAVVFFASWIKVMVLVVMASLIPDQEGAWLGLLKYVFLEALSAAILAPVLFFLLARGQHRLEEVKANS